MGRYAVSVLTADSGSMGYACVEQSVSMVDAVGYFSNFAKKRILEYSIEWLDRVKSTNDYCAACAACGEAEGKVVAAKFQEAGRGQRGNTWESPGGLNLTFSILLRPRFVPAQKQFLISKIAALAVSDWVSGYIPTGRVAVKWPNDIYVDDCKIAGILIENTFRSAEIEYSIVGVGINVNQEHFSADLPNPTSIFLHTSECVDPKQALPEVVACLNLWYEQLESGNYNLIDMRYLSRLYRKDVWASYKAGGVIFDARIRGVEPDGSLILEKRNGAVVSYAFKEVGFVV